MRNLKSLSLIALVSTLLMGSAFAKINTNWEKIKTQDGIKIFKGAVKGSPVVAFKGDAIINAKMAEVMTVLYDMENKTEWVDRLVETKLVRQLSQKSRVEYNRSHTPWPLSDRDFVYKAKISFNKTKTFAKIRLVSTNDKKAPKKDGIVRGELKESMYTLTALKGGKTRLTVEILADPKGMLPKWLVNIIQKKWPLKTIAGIREQIKKPGFKVHPKVKKMFQ
jgi:hypothetical protein